MKCLAYLLISLALVVVSVQGATQAAEASQSVSYGAFPCLWAGTAHVSLLDNQIYQCINVRGRADVVYFTAPSPKTNDAYSIKVFNTTEYNNYAANKPYICINDGQCELKDATIKNGNYMVDLDGSDVFIVLQDHNRIQRAFVDVSIKIFAP